jgi:hypothetical protein
VELKRTVNKTPGIMIRKLAVLCFICLSLALSAQQKQNKQNDSIIFTKLVHDYGILDVGSPGHCEFTFTNKKKTSLVLSNVRPSCGCTVAKWSKEPILPGKTGSIKINFSTKIPGTFLKTITVTSNAKNATVTLRIKGNVRINKITGNI